MSDRLFDVAIELFVNARQSYEHALVLEKQGRRLEALQVQVYAGMLNTAAEQVAEEAKKIETD